MALIVQKYGGSSVAVARQVTPSPEPREMDMLLATGEQVTIALLAMALHALGLRARSFTGPQVGMRTDRAHTRARIKAITAERVSRALDAGEVAVVAGFQGLSDEDEITTLGRGGSDLTAVALAAALAADVCEIYTDVDGVYTADPNIVVDMIVQNISRDGYTDMSFTVPRGDHARAVAALEAVAKSIGAQGVVHDERIAKVSIIGVGMRS